MDRIIGWDWLKYFFKVVGLLMLICFAMFFNNKWETDTVLLLRIIFSFYAIIYIAWETNVLPEKRIERYGKQ